MCQRQCQRFCRRHPSVWLLLLLLGLTGFIERSTSYDPITMTQCGGIWEGTFHPTTRPAVDYPAVHTQSRMCRQFKLGTPRRPIFLERASDTTPTSWIDPCLKFEVYTAGLYRDQIGIAVSYNRDPVQRTRCEAQKDYKINRIAMTAISQSSYPIGAFVHPFPTETRLKHDGKQFYYDSLDDASDVGDRDKDCQDYEANPGRGKHCTCLAGGTSDPRRPYFNTDAFYPPLQIVECPPFISHIGGGVDDRYSDRAKFPFPVANMIELDMTNHPLEPGYDAREEDGNDYHHLNFGFDLMFYLNRRKLTFIPFVIPEIEPLGLSLYAEVFQSANGVETISYHCVGIFLFYTQVIISEKYAKGEATPITITKCGDVGIPTEIFQFQDPVYADFSINDLSNSQWAYNEINYYTVERMKGLPPKDFTVVYDSMVPPKDPVPENPEPENPEPENPEPENPEPENPEPENPEPENPEPENPEPENPEPENPEPENPEPENPEPENPDPENPDPENPEPEKPEEPDEPENPEEPDVTLPPIIIVTDPPEEPLPPRPPQPPGDSNEPVKLPTKKEVYDVCQVTKACLSGTLVRPGDDAQVQTERPEDQTCINGNSCEVMLLFGQPRKGVVVANDEIVLEVYGKSERRSWVAVGFSHDLRMKEDFVVECVWEGGDPQNVHAYASTNSYTSLAGGGDPTRINTRFRRNQAQSKYIRLIRKTRTSDFLWCIFAIKRKVNLLDPSIKRISTLDRSEFYLLFAQGYEDVRVIGYDTGSGGLQPGHHQSYLYKNKTNLGQKFGPNPEQQDLLFAHAYVMILAWMFFMPIANFIGRYYKESYLNITIYVIGCRLWVFLHVIFASAGIISLCVGFGLLTFAKSDWDYVGGARPTTHLWSGVAAASLCTSNAFGALFLEGRDPKIRIHYSELIHGLFGHATFIASVVALNYGNTLYYSFATCSTSYVVVVWAVVYAFFHLFMSFHYLWVDWVMGNTGRVYWSCAAFATTVFPAYDETKVDDAPGTHIRTNILIAFVAVQAVFAATAALVYKFDTTPCYTLHNYDQFVYT